jgi:Flp pilus assembly protein TadD
MKRILSPLAIAGILSLVIFQGFQCGSPEFTGAKLQIQQKNYPEAVRLLEQEVGKNPSNAEAWYLLGWVQSEQNNIEGMDKAFTEAVKLSKDHAADIKNVRMYQWGKRLNSGVALLEKGSPDSMVYFDKAVADFQLAATAWPDTSLTYRYIGYASANAGNEDAALAAYTKAWEMGKDLDSYKRVGLIHINRGGDLKSKFEAENSEVLKIKVNLAELRKGMSKDELVRALGGPDQIKKGPKNTKQESYIYTKYNLTVNLDSDRVVTTSYSKPYVPSIDSTSYKAALKEFNAAITVLTEARNYNPKDSETLRLLLQAYVGADQIEPAIREFRKELAADPSNSTNHYILGVLLRSSGDFDGAVQEFHASYNLDPTKNDALFDLGATYYNWGVDILRRADEKGESTTEHKDKFSQALPHMEKYAEIAPTDIRVWETLGTIYAQLGQKEKAIEAFDKADKLRKAGTP